MAGDHPSFDLSFYTLEGVLGAPILKEATSCPPTPGPLVAQSSRALLVIPKDRPLEATDTETEREMDAFAEELNEVLTFDGVVLEEGEITTIPSDP